MQFGTLKHSGGRNCEITIRFFFTVNLKNYRKKEPFEREKSIEIFAIP